jgi:hypothetical protein
VDLSCWDGVQVSLNLPLRKLASVIPGGQHELLLLLKPRKATAASTAPQPSTVSHAANETRRLPCFTEEAETNLHEQLQAALASLNARRRVWIASGAALNAPPAADTRDGRERAASGSSPRALDEATASLLSANNFS